MDPMPRRREKPATPSQTRSQMQPVVRQRRRLFVYATAAVCLVALAGCDASTKSSANTASMPSASGTSAAREAGNGYAAGAPMSAPAMASAAPSAPGTAGNDAPAASTAAGSGTTPPLLANRSVIYTADITVRAANIKTAVAAVENLVSKRGGVVYSEQVDLTPKDPQNPGDASATVTLKVPPGELANTLDAVSHVGTEISRTENADDVTSKVVDVNARINAAKTSIARLTDLLSHTGNVADLLNVENELSQRDADLESLEQQQKALAAQTSQATITVHLQATPPVAKVVEKPKKTHVFGFLRGLRGGWHAFTATVSAIATAIGALLPFLIVLAIVAIAVLFGRRRFAHSRRGGEPATPTEGV